MNTQQTKVIPWFDLGAVNEHNIELMIAGLGAWSTLAREAVVTIGAKTCGGVFERLQKAVPEISIIPSITTSAIMGHSTGWSDLNNYDLLRRAIKIVTEQLPGKPLMLENEYALRDYMQGTVPIDLNIFAKGLALLPTTTEYIWYPSAGGWGDKLDRYMEIAKVVQRVLQPAHFVNHVSYYAYDEMYRVKTLHAAARLEEVAGKTVPVIYAKNFGDRMGLIPPALADVSRRYRDNTCYLYPNRKYWVTSALEYSTAMAISGSPVDPINLR